MSNPLTQKLKEIEEEFDRNEIKWLSPDPLEPKYMIPDMLAIKSFLHQSNLALLEVVKEEIGKMKKKTKRLNRVTKPPIKQIRDLEHHRTYNQALTDLSIFIDEGVKE